MQLDQPSEGVELRYACFELVHGQSGYQYQYASSDYGTLGWHICIWCWHCHKISEEWWKYETKVHWLNLLASLFQKQLLQ